MKSDSQQSQEGYRTAQTRCVHVPEYDSHTSHYSEHNRNSQIANHSQTRKCSSRQHSPQVAWDTEDTLDAFSMLTQERCTRSKYDKYLQNSRNGRDPISNMQIDQNHAKPTRHSYSDPNIEPMPNIYIDSRHAQMSTQNTTMVPNHLRSSNIQEDPNIQHAVAYHKRHYPSEAGRYRQVFPVTTEC